MYFRHLWNCKRVWFAAIGGLALIAASGQPAEALTNSFADTSNVVNDAVVSLSPIGIGPSCTGVLVAPTLVLTAGHCMQGAIIDGGSGEWNSQAPIWRAYNLPDPGAELSRNNGWISGLRGSTRMYVNRIIAPFNYNSRAVANVAACQAACADEGRCQGWTYQISTRMCFLKDTPRFQVNFGNTHGSSTLTIASSQYSTPGFADIVMMRLDTPVSATTATPATLLTHLPNTPEGIAAYLRRQTFQAVGFTILQANRRTAPMQFFQYPYVDNIDPLNDLAMVVVNNGLNSAIQGGDSGSPLFVTRTVGGRTQRFVVGINQGVGGSLNRYTLTGLNLRQRGQLLTLPYDRSTLDLRRSAAIGEWLQNIMWADFVASSARRPLYNWFGEGRSDNFVTSDPRWASDPRGVQMDGSGDYVDPRRHQDGYEMYRLEGYVFDPHRPQPSGTVALWSWFSSERGDNFLTSDPRWASNPASVRWAGESIANPRTQEGYTQYRLEGYIYDPRRPQPPNTRPLWSWFHPGRGDNFHTTDPRWGIPLATVRWVGNNIEGVDRDGYRLYRLEGFVPINPN